MGRFSPTIHPRAFDFGGILDQAARGYEFGQQQVDRRRRRTREDLIEKDRQEDRQRWLGALEAEDLNRPGVTGVGQFLDAEIAEGREPLTPENLTRTGQPDDMRPVELAPRSPQTVTLPSGEELTLQGRGPSFTPSGNVFDPTRAREETTLARALDAQEAQRFTPPAQPIQKPWEEAGFAEPDPYYEHKRKLADIERKSRPEPRKAEPREPRPVTPRRDAEDSIRQYYGRYEPDDETGIGRWAFPPQLTPQLYEEMVRAIMWNEPVPSLPPAPEAPEPEAPAEEPESPGGLARVGAFLKDFFTTGNEPSPEMLEADERARAEYEGAPTSGSAVAPAGPVPTSSRAMRPMANASGGPIGEDVGANYEAAIDSGASGGSEKIPVSQYEYDQAVNMSSKEYAARHYVVRR